MRYKQGDIESADKYFKFIEDQAADKLLFEAIKRKDEFEKLAENLDDYLQAQ